MALDASIILGGKPAQFDDPLTVQKNQATLADLMGRQQRQKFEFQGMQQEREAQQTLADLLRESGGNPEKTDALLYQRGMGTRVEPLREQRAKTGKATADADAARLKAIKDRIAIVGARLSSRLANPNVTPEDVVGDITGLVQEGVIDQAQGARMVQSLPGEPGRLRQALLAQGMELMDADRRVTLALGETKLEDQGGARQAFTTNQLTGQVTPGQTFAKTATPESVMTDNRARSEGAANRGVQMRGQNMTDQRSRDANKIMEGENAPNGAVLGVPMPAVLPWGNQSNPRDANKVKAAEFARGSKEIEKDVEAATKERDTAKNAARFIELNKTVNTGGITDKVALGRVIQSMGPQYSEMESITAKLAPAMRVPGSGASSDYDGKQFERATVGVDKPRKANENIAKAVVERAQLAQDYAEFRQTYFEQNRTLSGADRYWQQYSNANPIFDPAKPGTFELNNNRTTWREHFGKGGGNPAAAPAPAPAPASAAGGSVVDWSRLK